MECSCAENWAWGERKYSKVSRRCQREVLLDHHPEASTREAKLVSQSLGFHRLQRRCLSCVSGISFFWGVFLYYSRVLGKKTCRAPMNGKTGFNRVTHKYSSSGIENSILVFCILGIGQNAQCIYVNSTGDGEYKGCSSNDGDWEARLATSTWDSRVDLGHQRAASQCTDYCSPKDKVLKTFIQNSHLQPLGNRF